MGLVASGDCLPLACLGQIAERLRHWTPTGAPAVGERTGLAALADAPELWCEYERLTPLVSALSGQALRPTTVFARVYAHGASLPRHTEGDAAAWTLSLLLDSDRPWPLHTPGRAWWMNPGDALLIGNEIEHWRLPYAGVSAKIALWSWKHACA